MTQIKKHSKKTTLIIIILTLVILISATLFLFFYEKNNDFLVKNNKLSISGNRATPKYTIEKINETSNYTVFKVIYNSKKFMNQESKIYALLYVPQSEKSSKVPGLVFLPGGGVKKEDEPAAKAIANLGFAVLVIDQRGIGETGGFYPNYEQDKLIFDSKKESIQQLGVYDALLGVDVLKSLEYVDENNLFIGGSSMGGRYAMIAASLDEDIKKAIIISSAGFHIENTNLNKETYFLSIDPDRYVKDISPNKLVMIHSTTDSIINIEDAKYTFSLANEPKSFYTVDNCIHGYCDKMLPFIEQEIKN